MDLGGFDVVVVGAGSGGAVVAARLSENDNCRVLLLEAGPDWRSADAPIEVRAAGMGLPMDFTRIPEMHWGDVPFRRRHDHEPAHYWRGRGLGGCSSINAQLAVRPPLDDFDRWAEMGATAWSSELALELFRRIETDLDFGDAEYHGSGGPVPISRPDPARWTDLDHALAVAGPALGYQWCADMNAPGALGTMPWPSNRRHDRRVSSNDAYLEPVRDRPNLVVKGGALVDRLLFAGADRVVGVRARVDGQWQHIDAGQVILSAGTICSPAILGRSGIGPADHLRRLGIEVRADLPVGDGLQDHAIVAVTLNPLDTVPVPPERASMNVVVRYSSGLEGAPPGDINLLACGAFELMGNVAPVSLHMWQQETFSRGWLRLASCDPERLPDFDLGVLTDRRDVVRARDAVRRILDLLEHPAFTAIPRGDLGMGWAQAALGDVDDDDALDALMTQHADNCTHAASTCAMGKVTDEHARVIGVEGARVADLSIAPKVPRANPHLTATIIGEWVADLVSAP